MLSDARLLLLTALFLVGCSSASDVAVKTFRVLDAPANYVRHKIDPETTTTTTVATTQTSDVATPGRPVTAPSPTPSRSSSTQHHAEASPSAPPRGPGKSASSTQPKTTSLGSTRSTTGSAPQFPTARPVPGKPGYVYSVDPKGGIVDVTGYKSGDKAKDPYTQQVFIVP